MCRMADMEVDGFVLTSTDTICFSRYLPRTLWSCQKLTIAKSSCKRRMSTRILYQVVWYVMIVNSYINPNW